MKVLVFFEHEIFRPLEHVCDFECCMECSECSSIFEELERAQLKCCVQTALAQRSFGGENAACEAYLRNVPAYKITALQQLVDVLQRATLQRVAVYPGGVDRS